MCIICIIYNSYTFYENSAGRSRSWPWALLRPLSPPSIPKGIPSISGGQAPVILRRPQTLRWSP